jgi:mannonate dehydratase
MRVGLGQFSVVTTERLQFIRQCGVRDVMLNTPSLPGTEQWEAADLKDLVRRVSDHGLNLAIIENVPLAFYDRIMRGASGREQQLRHMIRTIENLAAADIKVLGYHFMPGRVWRTSRTTPIRGGALTTAFHLQLARDAPLTAERVYDEDEMWANYDWYLDRILPVCEANDVVLALHPDDPPVESLGGMPRLMRSHSAFQRVFEKHGSPFHKMNFCIGCWSEMRGGAGVVDAIRQFGSENRIAYVHFRDVIGSAEKFMECWLGDGNLNPAELLRELNEVGFQGLIFPDHTPRMTGDDDWGERGRAWTVGYLQAMLNHVLTSEV